MGRAAPALCCPLRSALSWVTQVYFKGFRTVGPEISVVSGLCRQSTDHSKVPFPIPEVVSTEKGTFSDLIQGLHAILSDSTSASCFPIPQPSWSVVYLNTRGDSFDIISPLEKLARDSEHSFCGAQTTTKTKTGDCMVCKDKLETRCHRC